MRHIAWLNAIEKDKEVPRRSKYPEDSPYLDPPYLTSYELWLATLWREVGSVEQGGMGLSPLKWSELVSWANACYPTEWVAYVPIGDDQYKPQVFQGTYLSNDELEIIMNMSKDYVSESSSATDPNAPCPKEVDYEKVDSVENAKAIEVALISLFGPQE